MTGDDLWLAVKFQSNSEIAGSPRNSFRASLEEAITGGKALISQGVDKITGGKALNELGGDKLTELYQTKNTG